METLKQTSVLVPLTAGEIFISALFRFESKDVADIWIISKTKKFDWKTIREEAKTKEAGVEPEIIYNFYKIFSSRNIR